MSKVKDKFFDFGHWTLEFGLLSSSEVVAQTHDVVFAEVAAALNFDEDELLVAGILDAVSRAERNINCLARRHNVIMTVERHFADARNHHPMLRALAVLLITESFARQHFDALNFIICSFVKHRERPPRTTVEARVIILFFLHVEALFIKV